MFIYHIIYHIINSVLELCTETMNTALWVSIVSVLIKPHFVVTTTFNLEGYDLMTDSPNVKHYVQCLCVQMDRSEHHHSHTTVKNTSLRFVSIFFNIKYTILTTISK